MVARLITLSTRPRKAFMAVSVVDQDEARMSAGAGEMRLSRRFGGDWAPISSSSGIAKAAPSQSYIYLHTFKTSLTPFCRSVVICIRMRR